MTETNWDEQEMLEWKRDAVISREYKESAERARARKSLSDVRNLLAHMKDNPMYKSDAFCGFTDTVFEFTSEIHDIEKDLDELCRNMIERFEIWEKQSLEEADKLQRKINNRNGRE